MSNTEGGELRSGGDTSGEPARESLIDVGAVSGALTALGVPPLLVDVAMESVGTTATGVLLYGSWARSEASEASDLDLLRLSDHRPSTLGSSKVSVSTYSVEQLESATGTLFGMHLARDGIVLHDTDGVLAGTLAGLAPPDPTALLERIRQFSAILRATTADLEVYLVGLTQVARYLLRTATYALALKSGSPCFSLNELAVRFGDPALPVLLSSHEGVYPTPTVDGFVDLRMRLERIVGPSNGHEFGSLQALIVGTWCSDRELSDLATLALNATSALPYDELPKVVL